MPVLWHKMVIFMTLDERKRIILQSIIKDYVETAEPVGSRAMVRKHGLKISAATVRNEMADLEELGYLEQPHTSAGRIPSELGFRYYVDSMMEMERLSDEEIENLLSDLDENLQEVEDVVNKVGGFLAQLTNYASFVILPSIKLSEFRSLQLIPLEKGKALLLLVTDFGLIIHRTMDIPENISVKDLTAVSKLLNQTFAHKKMSQLDRSALQLLREELKNRRKVVDQALEAIEKLLSQSGDEKVVISGMLNMLSEPEFKDLDRLRRIFKFIEEDGILKDLLTEDSGEDVDIKIGKENQVHDMQDMSLVYAKYKSLGEIGKIGVMGPVRMEYWRAAGTVFTLRSIIEELLNRR